MKTKQAVVEKCLFMVHVCERTPVEPNSGRENYSFQTETAKHAQIACTHHRSSLKVGLSFSHTDLDVLNCAVL